MILIFDVQIVNLIFDASMLYMESPEQLVPNQ